MRGSTFELGRLSRADQLPLPEPRAPGPRHQPRGRTAGLLGMTMDNRPDDPKTTDILVFLFFLLLVIGLVWMAVQSAVYGG